MSASDHLSPDEFPFFHGTNAELSPGDLVDPSYAGRNEGDRGPAKTAFFTADRYSARWYAGQSARNSRYSGGSNTGRVYEVEPTGPYDDDPDTENLLSDRAPFRTQHPLRVKGLAEQKEAADFDVPWHAPGRDPFEVWMGKTTTHPEGNRDQHGDLRKEREAG